MIDMYWRYHLNDIKYLKSSFHHYAVVDDVDDVAVDYDVDDVRNNNFVMQVHGMLLHHLKPIQSLPDYFDIVNWMHVLLHVDVHKLQLAVVLMIMMMKIYSTMVVQWDEPIE